MHPRNFGFERIVCTYYDVQKSVLHVQIRPIDLSITYNQRRVDLRRCLARLIRLHLDLL